MDDIIIFVIAIFLFIAGVIGSMDYGAHLKHECNLKAMEQKYPAVEIQAICKY